MIPARFVNAGEARRRFGDRVDRLAPLLLEVDPLADAVVETFATMPPGEGFRSFTEAAARGIDAVPHAPPSYRAFFERVERVPVWADFARMDRGGRLFLRYGILSGLVLGARSIILGYVSPAGNKPLVFSGRLEEQAPRRLSETSRFVQAVVLPGGMRPLAEGYQIALKVRVMHAQVRRMIDRSGRWDDQAWGRPINQHDMAGTVLLFSVALLQGLRTFGARFSRDDAEAYMHLWRWIGRLMGVSDEVLPTSEADALALGEIIAATQAPPDDDARALTHALLRTPILEARTEVQRAFAEPRAKVAAALARELLGADLASQLGLEESKYRHILPIVRSLTRTRDTLYRFLPARADQAVAQGLRYWEEIVRQGLGPEGTDFHPPEKLRQSPSS